MTDHNDNTVLTHRQNLNLTFPLQAGQIEEGGGSFISIFVERHSEQEEMR